MEKLTQAELLVRMDDFINQFGQWSNFMEYLNDMGYEYDEDEIQEVISQAEDDY